MRLKLHGIIVPNDGTPVEQTLAMELDLPSDWKKFHADNVAKLDQELVQKAITTSP